MPVLDELTLPPGLHLRPARADDASELFTIARVAKAHWGYDAATLAAWEADLAVSPMAIAAGLVCVAEVVGEVIGFAELALTPNEARLEGLWVRPEAMRRGAGRALLGWACARSRRSGYAAIEIDADPNAETFYLSMGAKRVGATPAALPGQPDRFRPQLRLATIPRDSFLEQTGL